MADTNFNYSTPAFRQHAGRPDFWYYALRISRDGSRFEIRPDMADRRMPIAA